VNEAFARRYTPGGSPVGRRVRYAESDRATPEPWLEIVGMVRDIGMTPTDFGEAPYRYYAASPAIASPLVMGIRLTSDPSALAPRVREMAAAVDPNLRLGAAQPLDDAGEARASHQSHGGAQGIVSAASFLAAVALSPGHRFAQLRAGRPTPATDDGARERPAHEALSRG
jgi:hypothetical protein